MKHLLLFLAVILFFLTGCSSNDKSRLQGRWIALDQGKRVESYITFSDTTVIMERKKQLSFKYEVSGDSLITTTYDQESGENVMDGVKIQMRNDSLFMLRKVAEEEYRMTKFTRLDSEFNKDNSIEGKWKWYDNFGNPGSILFKDNQDVFSEITFEYKEGSLELHNDGTMSLIFEENALPNLKYKFEKDTLFIEDIARKRMYRHLKINE
jgi:uncharacterized protein YcfL